MQMLNCADILGELLVLIPPLELDDAELEAPVVPPVACTEFPDLVPLTLAWAVVIVDETTLKCHISTNRTLTCSWAYVSSALLGILLEKFLQILSLLLLLQLYLSSSTSASRHSFFNSLQRFLLQLPLQRASSRNSSSGSSAYASSSSSDLSSWCSVSSSNHSSSCSTVSNSIKVVQVLR